MKPYWHLLKTLVPAAVVLAASITFAQPQPHGPDTLWTYTYADIFEDKAYAIAPMPDGGFIIGGYTEITNGAPRSLLIRLDSTGHQVWTQSYAEIYPSIYAVTRMPDGGFALTGGMGNTPVVRTDSLGNVLWSRQVHNDVGIEEGICVAPTADGGLVVLSAGSWTAFPDIDLTRLSHRGDSLWTRSFGGAAEDHAGQVLVLSDGGLLVVGSQNHQAYVLKTDSAGNEEWSTTFGHAVYSERLFSVCLTAEGEYVVVGTQTDDVNWQSYAYVARLTASGDTVWTHAYWDLGWARLFAVYALPSGGLVVAGSTGDTYLLALLDSAGGLVWHQHNATPGYYDNDAEAMCPAPHGGTAIAGYRGTIASNSQDLWVVRTDSLWRDTTSTSHAGLHPLTPNQFQLLDAYPNPFNARTAIRFSLDHPGSISLTVYDNLGRQVREFNSGILHTGYHELDIDGQGLASGCYYYTLKFGSRDHSGKIILLK